jgi:hypothetical protein
MYLDVKGLVTTGRGDLIDPVGLALPLRWLHKDGTAASAAEITAEWNRIKALQSMRLRGGGAFAQFATLRLSADEVNAVSMAKCDANDRAMAAEFPAWASWPADAQLAALSLAWAAGPGWPGLFPKCTAALLLGDFRTAVLEGTLNETGNPGLRPRNVAQRLLWANAADAQLAMADPEVLWYPRGFTIC